MKKQILFLIVFSQILISERVNAQVKSEISPITSYEKKIIKGKNDYAYYTLLQKEGTTFKVEGPGKLTINSRLRMSDENRATKKSSIKVVQSQSLVKIFEIPELATDSSKQNGEEKFSQIHRIEIDVPPGKNTYKVFSTDNIQTILIRGFYTEYPKPVWEDIVPTNNPEKREVRFTDTNKKQEYYLAAKKQNIQFVVYDTSQLRIIIRPAFTNKMLDDSKIVVNLVNVETGSLQTYKFSSSRGSDVEFINDGKSIPGKSTTFYVNLPKPIGKKGTYEVRLVDGAKFAAVRISQNKKLKK